MAYTKPWLNVGPGISTAMEASGDTPAGFSKYYNYDANGKLLPEPLPVGVKPFATLEEAWGSKGLYRAHNFSGTWVVDGPFGVGE